MKKVLCFAAAGLIAAGASAQSSQPQLYGSASYGLLETEVGSTDFDTPTLNLAFGGKFNPLLGLSETSIDTNFGDEDDDDFSYGIGISARLNNGIDLFGEYISLYDDDNVEIGGINLGASMRF